VSIVRAIASTRPATFRVPAPPGSRAGRPPDAPIRLSNHAPLFRRWNGTPPNRGRRPEKQRQISFPRAPRAATDLPLWSVVRFAPGRSLTACRLAFVTQSANGREASGPQTAASRKGRTFRLTGAPRRQVAAHTRRRRGPLPFFTDGRLLSLPLFC